MANSLDGGTIDAVIVGAGQAGLAMSRCLSEAGVGHIVLERYEIAHSWRNERWDSLRLLTPNWMTRLPGLDHDEPRPHDFDPADAVAERLTHYAHVIAAPVRELTNVVSIRHDDGFVVTTNRGTWECRIVVVASGACVVPFTPAFARLVPPDIDQLNALRYRRAAQLRPGKVIVVGASASGVQLADEIVRSGRDVVLCAGEHHRMVRRYRGVDIFGWMEITGMLDEPAGDADDRRLPPSMQLIGTPDHRTLDLNALQDLGVQVTGRLVGVHDHAALVGDGLAAHCAASDAAMFETLERIDRFATDNGLDDDVDAPDHIAATRVPESVDSIDLRGVDSIVWATGFRPSFPFLDPAWLDSRGAIVHRGGLASQPGLYVIGLPYTRRRSSNFIHGVGGDALALAEHVVSFLSDGGNDRSRIAPSASTVTRA